MICIMYGYVGAHIYRMCVSVCVGMCVWGCVHVHEQSRI